MKTMDGDESERGRGILSKSDRNYIRNPDEYNRQASYERRTHIRERVWNAFLDGALLLSLPADERGRIFNDWEEFADPVESESDPDDRPEHFGDVAESRGEWLEKLQAEFGFHAWFAFLYEGIEDSDEFDFKHTLTKSIKFAESQRGHVVTDLDFRVETRTQRDIEELTERFERGFELTTREIQRLREDADVSDAELGEYYDERRSQSALETAGGSPLDLVDESGSD